jgi:hypothetical protein
MIRDEITPAYEKVLPPSKPRFSRADAVEAEPKDHGLNVVVVCSSMEATRTALRKAETLASQLSAQITLVVPQTVPYPLPLMSPPVLLDFTERRLRALASDSPVAVVIRIYLCRDRFEALDMVLKPCSLIVLGGRKRWWPTAEKALARRLRRKGHEVILTETE